MEPEITLEIYHRNHFYHYIFQFLLRGDPPINIHAEFDIDPSECRKFLDIVKNNDSGSIGSRNRDRYGYYNIIETDDGFTSFSSGRSGILSSEIYVRVKNEDCVETLERWVKMMES